VLGINLKTLKIKLRYVTQLFLSYILLLLVSIGGLSFLTVSFVKHYVENQTIHHLKRQIIYMDHIMQLSDSPSVLFPILAQIKAQDGYDLRLTLISDNGNVQFDSDRAIELLDNHANRPEVKMAMSKGVGSSIRFSQSIEKKLVYVAKKTNDGIIYRLALPMHYLKNEWGRIRQKVIVYTVSIFGFCLLLTFLMSHWISSPLNWAIKTLHRIKHRKFEKIKPQPSFVKEINDVNWSLVEVSNNISQFIAKISREKEKKDIILNNMINGLIVIDLHLDIRVMNQASFKLFFNLNPSSQSVQLSDYPTIFSFASKLMTGEDVDPIEVDHGNGKTILISGSIYSEGKEPRGILTAQDITQLKRLESTRQKFVANVSHELKTPITFIRSMFETLVSAKQKNIDISLALLEKGVVHTDRLNQIIDDLLHLSTLETTGGEIEKASTNLQSVIDLAVQQCREQANEKNIQIIANGNDRQVRCNANLLGQAIKNLVENAIKYSPGSTQVTIDSHDEHDQMAIRIMDEGPGIDHQHLTKLFQRFYRVDTARSRQLGGTGLGLAIVKHIAQAHGGQATVSSTLGKGSAFTIFLPK
jgi:two-component system phosphate regulon sensor histidine kinase PhoR